MNWMCPRSISTRLVRSPCCSPTGLTAAVYRKRELMQRCYSVKPSVTAVASSYILQGDLSPSPSAETRLLLLRRSAHVSPHPGLWSVCVGRIEADDAPGNLETSTFSEKSSPPDPERKERMAAEIAARREITEELGPAMLAALRLHRQGAPFEIASEGPGREEGGKRWRVHPFVWQWRESRGPQQIQSARAVAEQTHSDRAVAEQTHSDKTVAEQPISNHQIAIEEQPGSNDQLASKTPSPDHAPVHIIRLGPEHDEARWVRLEELQTMPTVPGLAKTLEELLTDPGV